MSNAVSRMAACMREAVGHVRCEKGDAMLFLLSLPRSVVGPVGGEGMALVSGAIWNKRIKASMSEGM